MVVFSPVIWLRMVYSPGEEAERTRTRVLARSRSGAASIQRRPLLSTLKISNGGIMAGLRWYQNTVAPLCLSTLLTGPGQHGDVKRIVGASILETQFYFEAVALA